tara:strand:- start:216 stop:458 length:243 start_codon:yes stop_codon:yes gene_type:complete
MSKNEVVLDRFTLILTTKGKILFEREGIPLECHSEFLEILNAKDRTLQYLMEMVDTALTGLTRKLEILHGDNRETVPVQE